uniref:HVA22-like protein n=1 Tax=Musa acuminata subsp. malaccensis TaxID=214687 RepID=A0A804KU34_MUSAM|nr:PREDICTED: putative HVA22-like protein g [Musa acuminata subsp. malaccensis]XP_018674946.1 PREDICTED: putative HVA22-like protein g [Musa acuminata subsp. malaccensis]
MMGSFLSRGLILVFGYAYPAYECYKTVELNKPEIEQLLFWCQYWILVASLAILERLVDVFFSWLPMYCEAKLALYIYLWYPKMRGTTFVYGTFLRPYIAKHEIEIDRHLLEFRARFADIMLMYWQKASGYGRISFFDVLNRVTLLLQASRTHPSQKQADELPSSSPPAATEPARAETRASGSPAKNQPEEQLTTTTKTGVQPPESGPDAHASQTAEASSPTPKEAAIRATRGRLRKRPPIGHV